MSDNNKATGASDAAVQAAREIAQAMKRSSGGLEWTFNADEIAAIISKHFPSPVVQSGYEYSKGGICAAYVAGNETPEGTEMVMCGHRCIVPVTEPPTQERGYTHEDELPADMPREDYDKWYAQSWLDCGDIGVRVG